MVVFSGTYRCSASLISSIGDLVVGNFSKREDVAVFVVVPAVATMVVTAIVVSTLVLIVVAGLCCRLEK